MKHCTLFKMLINIFMNYALYGFEIIIIIFVVIFVVVSLEPG